MVQSVELLLDEDLDAACRRQWAALAAAGLPSQARHTGASNRPHVTLVAATTVPADAEQALPAAVWGLPLPLRLGGCVVFGQGRRHVLARLVVPGAALLALHARVAEVAEGSPGLAALTRPGAWTPHVTIARGLTPEQVGSALAVLGRAREQDGAAVAARRWDGEQRREWLL